MGMWLGYKELCSKIWYADSWNTILDLPIMELGNTFTEGKLCSALTQEEGRAEHSSYMNCFSFKIICRLKSNVWHDTFLTPSLGIIVLKCPLPCFEHW